MKKIIILVLTILLLQNTFSLVPNFLDNKDNLYYDEIIDIGLYDADKYQDINYLSIKIYGEEHNQEPKLYYYAFLNPTELYSIPLVFEKDLSSTLIITYEIKEIDEKLSFFLNLKENFLFDDVYICNKNNCVINYTDYWTDSEITIFGDNLYNYNLNIKDDAETTLLEIQNISLPFTIPVNLLQNKYFLYITLNATDLKNNKQYEKIFEITMHDVTEEEYYGSIDDRLYSEENRYLDEEIEDIGEETTITSENKTKDIKKLSNNQLALFLFIFIIILIVFFILFKKKGKI